ncbi:MAG: LysR family transcriptional regulator [Polyangiaceae bacterium]|nr:LysR family transcriptional regulator [Polyangiaceae bacterium]
MRYAPHPLSLRQLQYAVAVAEARSFRRAAELCRVAQPSLSAQVAELERALGVQLFERDRRRVIPTGAGEELVARARRLLIEAEDLVEAAARLGDPLAGTLRVGVIPTISPYLLPEIVPALKARHPRLTVAWVEDRTAALRARLEAGEIDAALLALEADIGDVEREVLAADPFLLAAPREHPLARPAGPVRPAELDGAGVLLLDDGHCFRDQALPYCERVGASELGFRATSLPTLAQMVAGGAGVTLLPLLALPTENRNGVLAVRPFAEPAPGRTIALVWRRRSPLDAGLRQVAAVIRETYIALAPRLRAAVDAATAPHDDRRKARPRARG